MKPYTALLSSTLTHTTGSSTTSIHLIHTPILPAATTTPLLHSHASTLSLYQYRYMHHHSTRSQQQHYPPPPHTQQHQQQPVSSHYQQHQSPYTQQQQQHQHQRYSQSSSVPIREAGIFSRLADYGQRGIVWGLIGLSGWGIYKIGTGYYAIRNRRMEWEEQHPELAQQVRQQQLVEKEKERLAKG